MHRDEQHWILLKNAYAFTKSFIVISGTKGKEALWNDDKQKGMSCIHLYSSFLSNIIKILYSLVNKVKNIHFHYDSVLESKKKSLLLKRKSEKVKKHW